MATFIFASAPSCVRAVGLDAISLGIVRLGLASLATTIVLVCQRKLTIAELRSWSLATWRTLVLVGLAFGIHWVLFFLSIKLASAAIGTIGFATYGVQLLVLGWLLGLSRVTWLDVVGVLLALMGTFFLVPEFSMQNNQTLGLGIGVLSGLAAAALPLLHQRNVLVDVQLRTWGQFTFALIVFLCCWPLAKWDTFESHDLPLILYLGLGIGWIGHGMWVRVTSVLSTTTLGILSYLYLPASLLVSTVTLGERLSGRMLLGAILVLVANTVVLWNQLRNQTLAAQTA